MASILLTKGPVPGQFGAGQFSADNSARTIRRRTTRRGQFGATIRPGQFGAKYIIINFIENSATSQPYFLTSRFHFSNIFFINPASISTIFFHQSRFHFGNIFHQYSFLFSIPTSILAIFLHQYRFHFSNIYFPSNIHFIIWL